MKKNRTLLALFKLQNGIPCSLCSSRIEIQKVISIKGNFAILESKEKLPHWACWILYDIKNQKQITSRPKDSTEIPRITLEDLIKTRKSYEVS